MKKSSIRKYSFKKNTRRITGKEKKYGLKYWWREQQAENRKKLSVIIICAAAAIAVISGSALTAIVLRSKTVYAAFYGIPEAVSGELTRQIREIRSGRIKFIILNPAVPLPRNTAKRYDLLFTWTGRQTENFSKKAARLPDSVYNLMPAPVRKAGQTNNGYYAVPLLIDNYELAFYRTYRNNAKLLLPETLDDFEKYLETIKRYTDVPLMCSGGDDRTLIALVSALAESMCGSAGYEKLFETVGTEKNFENILSVTLSGDNTFTSVLDRIRSWQRKKLIHPLWYMATEQDVLTLMKNHLTGVIFMALSDHRKKPLVLIKYYDSTRFLPDTANAVHALVAPVIAGIAFSSKTEKQEILENLIHTDNQEQLSTISGLAPASSRAEANDRQADDVRFWAASCQGGPVPDLSSAAFTKPEQSVAFATAVREYLKQ